MNQRLQLCSAIAKHAFPWRLTWYRRQFVNCELLRCCGCWGFRPLYRGIYPYIFAIEIWPDDVQFNLLDAFNNIAVDGKETSTSFSFELGKPYQTCENEPGHLTISTNPSENVLIHHTFIPSKGWNIENKTVFTEEGITCYVKNLNSDVTTVNYYKKHLANGKSARVDSWIDISKFAFFEELKGT